MDDFERAEDLELFDVFREIAAGETEVDELAFREIGEFLDAGLHVVEGDALAFGDGGEIDFTFDSLVVLDRSGRDGDAEIALGLHDGDPEIALKGDAAVRRPDGLHRGGGVAVREDVEDGGIGGGFGLGVHGKRASLRTGRDEADGTSGGGDLPGVGAGRGGLNRDGSQRRAPTEKPSGNQRSTGNQVSVPSL